MKGKRRLKKKPIIILVLLIILTVVGITFTKKTIEELNYRKTIEYKLLQAGYKENEIELLRDKTDEEFMNSLLDIEYDEMYLEILKEKYYIKSNLRKYIDYYEEHLNSKTYDIVSIVNTHRDKDFYSEILKSDTSKNYLIINNKYYKLDEKYVPQNLVKVTVQHAYGNDNKLVSVVYDAFKQMFTDAKKENITLIINSSYRPYKEQEEIYNDYLKKHGQEYADKYAARPGHSEHQTGLAIDITTYGVSGDKFDQSKAFKWLQDNAYKYGFILRYPKDKEKITGYNYESWHYRYVGVETATKLRNENITYDEYYAYYIENVPSK